MKHELKLRMKEEFDLFEVEGEGQDIKNESD